MNIKQFIAREWITLLILFIMLLNPFYYGYRVAILFVFVIFFQLKKYLPLFDKNVLWLFVFSCVYELMAFNRLDSYNESLISIIPNLFIPSTLYLVGKNLFFRYASSDIRVFLCFFIASSFSIVPLISILEQISSNGFIEGTRALYLLWNKNALISATGLGSYFTLNMASIALLNIPTKSKTEKRVKAAFMVLFVFSLICVLRLGSRTQLVIAAVAYLASFIVNFSKISKFGKFIQIVIFGGIVFYFTYLLTSHSELLLFYEDRMDSTESGIAQAGGRTERWIGALQSIVTDPMGWEFERFGYAHNLWLDVARVSGVLALIPLLIFSINSISALLKSIRRLGNSIFIRAMVFSFLLSLILIFFVEPIMEGMYLAFLLFCLLVGYLVGLVKTKVIKR